MSTTQPNHSDLSRLKAELMDARMALARAPLHLEKQCKDRVREILAQIETLEEGCPIKPKPADVCIARPAPTSASMLVPRAQVNKTAPSVKKYDRALLDEDVSGYANAKISGNKRKMERIDSYGYPPEFYGEVERYIRTMFPNDTCASQAEATGQSEAPALALARSVNHENHGATSVSPQIPAAGRPRENVLQENVSAFRAYMRSRGERREDDPQIEEFLSNVASLLQLRADAEDNFKRNPHLAKNKAKALPLDWSKIASRLSGEGETPPETLLTRICRECVDVVESLLHNLRKVLVREREMARLGTVQQVDPHCLRWLSRQPGRFALEKAGTRQKILAIVRHENHNTLENRVFKDFLQRANAGARRYLKENKNKFPEHATIKTVSRFQKLAQEGLEMQVMDTISKLDELPIPNYVLRQERRYSKIYKNYCLHVREASVAERLWERRDELAGLLHRLGEEIPIQTSPSARFHCPLWFNYIDGRQDFLDKPFYPNQLQK